LGDDGSIGIAFCFDIYNINNEACFVNRKFGDYVQIGIMIFVIVFGLVICYQAVKYILGGSWGVEEFALALLGVGISLIFMNSMKLTRLGSDLGHLNRQFCCLAKDFKEHMVSYH